MEKEEEDGGDGEFRPASRLRRNDRHLIDVSTYLLEQSALIGSNENVETNKLEESLAATQFFSPGQVTAHMHIYIYILLQFKYEKISIG